MGAAVSTCLSYVIMFVIRFFHSRTSVAIRWDIPRFIISVVLVTALCGVMILEIPYWIPVSVVLTGAVTVLNFENLLRAAKKVLRRG